MVDSDSARHSHAPAIPSPDETSPLRDKSPLQVLDNAQALTAFVRDWLRLQGRVAREAAKEAA